MRIKRYESSNHININLIIVFMKPRPLIVLTGIIFVFIVACQKEQVVDSVVFNVQDSDIPAFSEEDTLPTIDLFTLSFVTLPSGNTIPVCKGSPKDCMRIVPNNAEFETQMDLIIANQQFKLGTREKNLLAQYLPKEIYEGIQSKELKVKKVKQEQEDFYFVVPKHMQGEVKNKSDVAFTLDVVKGNGR
jgi:hypothetical protein